MSNCSYRLWCWWLFGRSASFATSAYKQPLQTFHFTWSSKTTGRCGIWGSHSGDHDEYWDVTLCIALKVHPKRRLNFNRLDDVISQKIVLYWKMYHWQSEDECGTCMMVLWHISAVLCERFTVTPVVTDGYVEEEPLHGLHAHRIWILWIFYLWRHLNTFVYAAPVDNKEALHHRIEDACQTICNYPGIFVRMWRSLMRRVKACIQSHAGHFEHL
jgi:hypothetical protein